MYAVVYQLYDDVRVEGVCDTSEDADALANSLAKQLDRQYGVLKEGSWRGHLTIQEVQKFSHNHIFALGNLT